MIWLTWRQFRAATAMMAGALILLTAILALTGQGLADEFSTGTAACVTKDGGCANFFQDFYHDHQTSFLAVTAIVLVLPALIGLFWGAPLLTREFEAGTHQLIWNQSITRTRWLAVKLGLTGLAAMTAAGVGSLAVTWWSGPIDRSAAANTPSFPRLGSLLFDARGIVPIGYAAFAVVLGVTIGMLVRRTLPAMAITLVAFVSIQVAMPLLIRPHLVPPVHSTVEISDSKIDIADFRPSGLHLALEKQVSRDTSAWVLSSRLVDASGATVRGSLPVSTSTGPCAPPKPAERPAGEPQEPGQELAACFAELKRLGYRQEVTYHPSSRYWTFQWIETGIYAALTLALAGFCFWRIRSRSF